jgi:hypothetical protein
MMAVPPTDNVLVLLSAVHQILPEVFIDHCRAFMKKAVLKANSAVTELEGLHCYQQDSPTDEILNQFHPPLILTTSLPEIRFSSWLQ